MFDRLTATAAHEAGDFFANAGAPSQVWARWANSVGQRDPFYLAPGGVTPEVRKLCATGQLLCPVAGCPAPEFVARGGPERRHHFAHYPGAGVTHQDRQIWLREAIAMLAVWVGVHPGITGAEDGDTVSATSNRSGVTVTMRVVYDNGFDPAADLMQATRQVLVGHARRLLLPRQECADVQDAWWCGRPRLVGQLLDQQGHVIAVNPEQRRVATLVDAATARQAGVLPPGAAGGYPVVALVRELAQCRLTERGLMTPVRARLDAYRSGLEKAERERRRRRGPGRRVPLSSWERNAAHPGTYPFRRPNTGRSCEDSPVSTPDDVAGTSRVQRPIDRDGTAEHTPAHALPLEEADPRQISRVPPGGHDWPPRARGIDECVPGRWEPLAADVRQSFGGRLPAFLSEPFEQPTEGPRSPDLWRPALYRIFIVQRAGESFFERQVVGALVWHQWFTEDRWSAGACAQATRRFLARLKALGMITTGHAEGEWQVAEAAPSNHSPA